MKKIFGFLICALLISVRVYAEYDIPTDKSYTFDRANVASVLAEFIEDEKKAEKAADKYNELSNNSENAISAVDFVDVCVAGGMNMKLADGSGYMKCLDMFMKLIEMQNLDAGGFDMYCPATGNALKSITDKTQVGDVCGGTPDTYIEYGHVTLKTDDKNGQHKYVCTCTPQSCKDGYYWNKEKYQCSVKDKEGYCVRHILGSFEYKNGKLPTDSGVGLNDWNKRNNAYYNDKYAQINASTDAFNRCVEYGANQGCRIRGALASADVGSGFGSAKKYQVICNPENYEIAADKKVQEDKEKKHKAELEQNTSYYEVCGKKDKGKGECIDNVFTRKIIGGTQVSYATGNALVKEYARVRLGDEITCGGDSYDKNIRKSGTEYFIKCKSLKDLTKYYEFKFDDLEESKDLTANTSVYNAVWHIIYNYNIAKNSHNGYDTGTKANCDAVNATFKKICNGCGTEWRESGYIETKGKKFCYDVINIADNTTCKKSPNDLNTAFDIDPFIFCKNTHNQLKNTGSMESLLKQYISDKSGYNVSKIECYPQTLCYSGTGCGGVIGHGDDIKTCVVHGNKDYTVDFVFDDVNEFSKKLSEVSMDAMQCVIGGHELSVKLGTELNAKNKGKKCTGLTKELCTDLDKMIRNRGGSGAHYDTKKRACILNSAEEYATQELAQNVAIGAVVAVGTSLFVIGSGGVGAALIVGGSMFAVDTAVNGGLYIVEKLEDGQAGRRFTRFINAAKKCKDSKCAQLVIEQNYNDLNAVVDELNFEDAAEFQTELERLLDLMDVCRMDDDGTVYMGTKDGDCLLAIRQLNLASENKSLQYASFGLMIGDFAFNPASAFSKVLSKGGKIAKILSKIDNLGDLTGLNGIDFILRRFGKQAHLRSGSKTIGKDYYRIMINDGDNVNEIVTTLKREGYYVSSNKADGEKFIAVSKENIFGPWDNNTNNWLKYGNNVGNTMDADFVRLKNKASQNFDRYLQEFLNTGTSNGLPVSGRLSRAEWEQLNVSLRNQGVELFETQMWSEKTGKYEDVMKFRKANNVVSNNSINVLLKRFNKTAVLRSGSTNSLGYDYYRIVINDGDDVNGILSVLQSNGYYISANKADGKKFLAVSKDNIFGPWDNSKNNWLKYSDTIDNINNESLIFSKVYNDMPEEAIKAKLEYVYINSYVGDRIDTEAAVRALKNAGIYDEAKTIELARDLADETVRRIKNSDTDIIDRMKKYKRLNNEEKKRLAGDLHEIITTERRNHVGNTQLGYDFTTHWSSNSGKGTYDSPFLFIYGLKGDSIEGLIGIVFHENTHALQRLGKSAIPKPFAEWNLSHYANKDDYGKLYYDNLIEVEAYAIQREAARQVMKALGL